MAKPSNDTKPNIVINKRDSGPTKPGKIKIPPVIPPAQGKDSGKTKK